MVPMLVLLVVLAAIVFLLVKSVQDARRSGATDAATAPQPPPRRPTPRPRPRPRQRRSKPKVDEAALASHVAKLREAVARDLISMEEAVASVIRQTDGALSDEAARKLLEQDDAA